VVEFEAPTRGLAESSSNLMMTRLFDVPARNYARALTLSLAFLTPIFAAIVPAAVSAAPAVNVAECVEFSEQSVNDHDTKITLVSTCEAKLKCTISWQLSCEPGDPGRKEGRTMTLPAGDERSVMMSTRACGDKEWELNDVSWDCVQR